MVRSSGWCLLAAGFVIAVAALVAGQAGPPVRVAPRVLSEATSGEIRGRDDINAAGYSIDGDGGAG